MSYQPLPAATPQPVPRSPGRALTWLGVLLVAAGLGAGAALYVVAQGQYDSRVESLAEDSGALSGCVTELDFSKTGTFVLYYVSSGAVRVNGTNEGCVEDGTDEDVIVDVDADTDVPDMTVTLTDDEGDEVRLSRTTLDSDKALTSGGVEAWPYRQVSIRNEGTYRIEITTDDPNVERFAIGVGPKIDEPSLLLPALAAAAGLALGILLFVIGGARGSAARRQPTGTAVGYGYPAEPGFQGPGQYPVQPPVMYQPPAAQGFDHPTRSMPPIAHSPEPVGPFTPPSGPPPSGSPWARPPESTGWTAPAAPTTPAAPTPAPAPPAPAAPAPHAPPPVGDDGAEQR